MIIEIDKYTNEEGKIVYRADMKGLPGSPPVGEDYTPEGSVNNLWVRLYADLKSWAKYIDVMEKVEFVYLYEEDNEEAIERGRYRLTADDYMYKIHFSEDDNEWVGTCPGFSSLSFVSQMKLDALHGIYELVSTSISDIYEEGNTPPQPVLNDTPVIKQPFVHKYKGFLTHTKWNLDEQMWIGSVINAGEEQILYHAKEEGALKEAISEAIDTFLESIAPDENQIVEVIEL